MPAHVIDNVKITNRRVIANEFNKYFNSIASSLNESIIGLNISDQRFSSFEDYLLPANKNSIFLYDCSTDDILEIISKFDNNKSSDIPIRIIKKTAHIISNPLAQYFNILMAEGTFPDVLKVGKVTPVYKKETPKTLEITGQSQLYLSLAKFLKKLFTVGSTALLYPKTYLTKTNLGLGSPIQPVML